MGSRNEGDEELIDAVAQERSLPIGIKNGMSGKIDIALQCIQRVNELRGANSAPAVLIHRGGEDIRDPLAWEKSYREAWNTYRRKSYSRHGSWQ